MPKKEVQNRIESEEKKKKIQHRVFAHGHPCNYLLILPSSIACIIAMAADAQLGPIQDCKYSEEIQRTDLELVNLLSAATLSNR